MKTWIDYEDEEEKKNEHFALILNFVLSMKILKIYEKQLRKMATFCHSFGGCCDCCFLFMSLK